MPVTYYGSAISPHIDRTPEGFLICRDVPVARTGPQRYLAREMQLDGDPERLIDVNRHPEDVFEPATLASLEGKPVTDGHPAEGVTAENYSSYTKGHIQNVRQVILRFFFCPSYGPQTLTKDFLCKHRASP